MRKARAAGFSGFRIADSPLESRCAFPPPHPPKTWATPAASVAERTRLPRVVAKHRVAQVYARSQAQVRGA